MKIKNFLPKTFFGRSLAIILIPFIILQFVMIYIFYERHWEDVGRRLVLALGGQISFIIKEMELNNFDEKKINAIFDRAQQNFLISSKFYTAKNIDDFHQHKIVSLLDNTLYKSLSERISYSYKFDTKTVKKTVLIYVESDLGVIEFSIARKNLYSSTIEVFMGWMFFTALLMIIMALHFMRQQIKPLKNITLAAEEFGKGNNDFDLKPRGANELRLLSAVFIKMRERIKHQILQRTQMLAGIGHDLRTPLTRMNLQIALLKDKSAKGSLSSDVNEMREMIDDYLVFSKGEAEEKITATNLYEFFKVLLKKNKLYKNIRVTLKLKKNTVLLFKPLSMKRAVLNIIENALFFSNNNMLISEQKIKNYIKIFIQDDGPGIPENEREKVFGAFYRIDESRMSKSGNTGLGLAIAKNIIEGHGGNISLSKSSLGGLKVTIKLPTS